MSDMHIVTGAGPIGWTVAEQLAGRGHRVRLLTRSGSGPEDPLIERWKVDVSQPDGLEAAIEDGVVVFHCIHASGYSAKTWAHELPATEQTVLKAAGRVGAVVVFPESLYAYDRPKDLMTERSSREAASGKRGIRARLLRARAASQTPTVSVVASDYFGPRALHAHAGERMVPAALAGRTIRVMGNPDMPHSFTYVPDLAAAMIAAAHNPAAWNSVLHAPTGPAVTQRTMAAAFARAAGEPAPKVGSIPGWVVRAAGLLWADARELAEMLYQFEEPFVMDSSYTQALLGLAPTPLATAAKETVRWWQGEHAAARR